MKKQKTSEFQKQIYDGKIKHYTPIYSDKENFCVYMQKHINDSKKAGILGYSLKAVKNKAQITKLALTSNQKVLDAGCGPGILINQLKAIYSINGFGADISRLAISRAKQAGDKEIKYSVAKLERLPFKNGFFDATVSFDVLEHVEDKQKTLKEIIRVTKPGGKILIYAISSRDFLTWHWMLRLITFGRFGVDTEGGHIRENFADPVWVKDYMASCGVEKIKTSFFHSFFTLLADEIIFNLLKLGKTKAANNTKIAKTNYKGVSVRRRFAYILLKGIRFFAELLEFPWKIFKLSNGFFIYGEKINTGRK